MSKNNQKPNPRGFVDRFYNTTLNQIPKQSSKLIPKQKNQINKTQDSQKQSSYESEKPPYIGKEFVNDRPAPLFLTTKPDLT